MIAKSLNLVDLDFAGLKADLIEFYKSQPLFKDFDFTGSNLNLQADILSYNTNKNSFLVNMLLSEAFLDSAQLTSSVFSHGKNLNYLPRSARSSKANITVSFESTGVNQPYVIDKGSSFATLIKNQSYVFSMPETISVSSANTSFAFTTDIYEGIYLKDSYIFQTSEANTYPRFTITNKTVDTSSLTVAVYEDNSQVPTIYLLATSLLGLNNLDKIYFLQVSEQGYYEIQFGDGVIGQPPKQNSLIVLDYRITNATKSNGASSFVINFDPTNNTDTINNVLVTTNDQAVGGAEPEDIESVRYYAPRAFQTQERCIVPSDYETLLKINFPEINAVSVWGGEDETPPRYGYVMVCIDLPGFTTLPVTKQNAYNAFLKARCPMSVEPLFVDPQYTYLQVNSLVRYNINITTNTMEYIKSLIKTVVANYNIDQLNDFNVILRFSQLTRQIDNADPSIISNLTDITIYKKLSPSTGAIANYTINFNTALVNNLGEATSQFDEQLCLTSSPFTYEGNYCRLEDDGLGNVKVVKVLNNERNVIDTVGTINYDTGVITLNNMVFDSYEGIYFKVYVRPRDLDVMVFKNTILTIESDEINLTIEPISG